MLTVVECPSYLRTAKEILSEDERAEFVDWIAENPEAGDLIVGSGGIRKVRWRRAGTGKSGGVRVIFCARSKTGKVFLLYAYAKSVKDSISKEFAAWLKAQVEELK
jgi:hypothetical protein